MTTLFITILNMSIAASVVVLAVMLVRIPMKKAPKIFSYMLWGVVLFRLVCPFSFESVFSLMPTSPNTIPQDIVHSQNPTIQTGVQFVDTPINTVINNALPNTNPDNSINPIRAVFGIAGYIWLSGFIALLLYATIGYVRLKRRVYYATLLRENIYETDKINTPFVFGFIHPKIYMPIEIEPSQHDYIVKHEQTHIRRRDYLIKPFAFIVFALHWFNPLMWAAYWLMAKDIEMSCDEAVLQKTDGDIRGVYSSSLLNLSVKRGSLLLTPLAFGESGVKERVKNVLSFKKPAIWITVVSLLVVTVFLVGFASNRVDIGISDFNAQKRNMTIDDVRGLAAKGEALTVADFDLYHAESTDETSAYAPTFIVDDGSYILYILGSHVSDNVAFQIILTRADDIGNDTGGIDIRYYDVDKYVRDGTRELVRAVQEETRWARRPMVMIDDSIYMSTGREVSAEVDDTAILGTIISSVDVSELPTENGQSNFGFESSEYAYYENGVVVKIDGKWVFFEKESNAENN